MRLPSDPVISPESWDTFVLSVGDLAVVGPSQVIVDTGATESACGIRSMDKLRFWTPALGPLSFYLLDDTCSHETPKAQNTPLLLGGRALRSMKAILSYEDNLMTFEKEDGSGLAVLSLHPTRNGHLAVDLKESSTPLGIFQAFVQEELGLNVVMPGEPRHSLDVFKNPGLFKAMASLQVGDRGAHATGPLAHEANVHGRWCGEALGRLRRGLGTGQPVRKLDVVREMRAKALLPSSGWLQRKIPTSWTPVIGVASCPRRASHGALFRGHDGHTGQRTLSRTHWAPPSRRTDSADHSAHAQGAQGESQGESSSFLASFGQRPTPSKAPAISAVNREILLTTAATSSEAPGTSEEIENLQRRLETQKSALLEEMALRFNGGGDEEMVEWLRTDPEEENTDHDNE
eukprot:s3318_g6.t2